MKQILLFALLCFSFALAAQPANDHCSGADVIPAQPYGDFSTPYFVTTQAATALARPSVALTLLMRMTMSGSSLRLPTPA